MALLILGLVGLAIGIWLGLPARYEQTPEDIERLMDKGGGMRRKRQKRSLSPVAWLQRRLSPRTPPPSRRRGFKLEAPAEGTGGWPRAADSRASRPARDSSRESSRDSARPKDDEPSAERKPRTRQNLREGRFKLRPPGESGGS